MRVAINGLGRIGRAILKIVLDTAGLELVAVNDVASSRNLAYLIAYDSVYGRYAQRVRAEDGTLFVNEKPYRAFAERDPARLPWRELGIELVFECTGAFSRLDELRKHIEAGAANVLLSAPAKEENVETVVHGVNVKGRHTQIVSCASCTTNCITPLVEIIGRRLGLAKAVMTTVHAYTVSQAIVDEPNKNFRRGRAGAANMVPTSTGAALATLRALPQYRGRFHGAAIRVPVPVGSIADVTFVTTRNTTVAEVNAIFVEESKTKRYEGVLGVAEDPIVSSDIIGDSRASIVDLAMTMVVDGDLLKIMSWYDNEWGYASQMVREARSIASDTRDAAR